MTDSSPDQVAPVRGTGVSRPVLLLVALLGLLGLLGVGGVVVASLPMHAGSPAHHRVTGSITSSVTYQAAQNFGLSDGTPVTIYNDAGTVIASTFLTNTHDIPDTIFPDDDHYWHVTADFTADVPDSPFYQVEVGSHGKLTYTRAEMESQSWSVDLSV